MTKPEGVMLPNDIERRQIFHALKRWSSYTAWKRILDLYQAWADAGEWSVRRASELGLSDKSSIKESRLVLILKGLAELDEAVGRLRRGDKRIFRYSSHAELTRAGRPLSHEEEMLWRAEDGDIIIYYDTTPGWSDYARSVTELAAAWGECAPDIIQDSYGGKPTNDAPTIYGVWYQEWLPKMTFPVPLPEVPSPVDDVLVRTGSTVPYSGIWEPVDAPVKKIISLFKAPPPKGPFPLVGCMNYLHGGMRAPRAKQETETESLRADVTWRLLWRDDRYLDGTIPEEERHYVFLQPEAPPIETTVPATSATSHSMTVAESGQRAPVAGRWLVEDDLQASVTISEGKELPMHQGRKVRWVLASV